MSQPWPLLFGRWTKARAKLLRARCRLGKVTRKSSSLKKKGRLLWQRPKPGKSLKRAVRR